MRAPTFRAQLLASFVGGALIVGALALVILDRSLADDLTAELDARLVAQAEGAATWMSLPRVDRQGGEPRFDRHAERLARLAGAWVTIIGEDGRVLGDSASAGAEREAGEEIVAARSGLVGRAARFYAEHQATMYLVAVSSPGGEIVRLGVPMSAIESPRARMRARLLVAGALGIALAIGLGTVAASSLARPVVRERDRLSAILEGMVEGVLGVGGDGVVVLANASATALLGRPPIGARLDALLPDASPGAREIARADRTLLVTMQTLDVGAVLVLHDVTERQRLEAMRRDFIAQISHEIRTPVASIQGYAETLLGGVDEATRGEFLEVIHRQALRISRLVSALLRLAELEARAPAEQRRERVSLRAVALHVVETVRERAAAAGVELRIDVDERLAAIGDPDDLEQIVENLTDNAIRYGANPGEVTISGAPDGDRVTISVTDRGPGIAPEHLPRLFERFYRVDPARSRRVGGTGLGLAIVDRLARAMGGSVRAESKLGEGSRFVVTLLPAEVSR